MATVNSGVVRIASWNIEFGMRVDEAIETIRDHDELAGADVVLLQEMDEDGVARIAAELGADHCYARASVHRKTGRDFGNAIISRHPLTPEAALPLPHKPRFRGEWRIAAVAVVEVGGVGIRVVSTHTEIPTLRLKYRRRQFDRVATAAAQSDVVVIGGDFNTVTSRAIGVLRSVMADHGMDTVELPVPVTLRWPQSTRRAIELHLDHLFVRGITVTDAGVVTTSSGSDHWPIWTVGTIGSRTPVL